MQELITCANSGRGWAAERAQMALQISAALEQRAIDPGEARFDDQHELRSVSNRLAI